MFSVEIKTHHVFYVGNRCTLESPGELTLPRVVEVDSARGQVEHLGVVRASELRRPEEFREKLE